MSDARELLREALEASRVALDDWLNTHAPEHCRESRVREATDRIMANGGTLAYIASLQARNREALALSAAPHRPRSTLCQERDTQCGSYDCRWPQCKFAAPVHAPPAGPRVSREKATQPWERLGTFRDSTQIVREIADRMDALPEDWHTEASQLRSVADFVEYAATAAEPTEAMIAASDVLSQDHPIAIAARLTASPHCATCRDMREHAAGALIALAVPAPPAEPCDTCVKWRRLAQEYIMHYINQTNPMAGIEEAAIGAAPAAEPVAQPERQSNKAAPTPDAAGQPRSGYQCGESTPPPANEGGIPSAATHEPVAQQPPPSREHALDELAAIGQEMGEYAAQQPPPLEWCDECACRHTPESERVIHGAQQPEAPTLADDARRFKWHPEGMMPALHGYRPNFVRGVEYDKAAKRIRALEAERDAAMGSVKHYAEIYAASRERERALWSAADRARWCIKLLIGRKPVRDVTETLAELDRALATPDSAASPTGGER